MKSFISYSLLILLSCSRSTLTKIDRYPTSELNGQICTEIIHALTDHYKGFDLEIFSISQKHLIKKQLSRISINTKKDEELIQDYIDYLSNQIPRDITKDIELISRLKSDTYEYNGFKKFKKRMDKFERIKNEITIKTQKKHQSNKSSTEIEKIINDEYVKYKNLYKGCHTKSITDEHKDGGKTFTYFMMATSATSSGAFYTWENRKEEDFGSKVFFQKLGYEMTADAMWAFLASKIFGNPEGSFLSQSIKLYLADNLLVATDALIWESLFSEGNEDALKRIDTLKKSDNFDKDLKELVQFLERNKFMDEVKNRFQSILIELKVKSPNNTIDWSTVSKKDLENDEIVEQLMKAALIEMYEEKERAYSLGTYGADRYGFYSTIGIPSMFIDGFVTAAIYKIMCMAPYNRKKAFMNGALVFTFYSVLFDMVVYPGRKYSIGE